jgi:hypothetical protein
LKKVLFKNRFTHNTQWPSLELTVLTPRSLGLRVRRSVLSAPLECLKPACPQATRSARWLHQRQPLIRVACLRPMDVGMVHRQHPAWLGTPRLQAGPTREMHIPRWDSYRAARPATGECHKAAA